MPKRKVLDRKFNVAAKDATDEQHKYVSQAHFSASDNLDHVSETMADASKPSNRKCFVDRAYGIFGRDRDRTAKSLLRFFCMLGRQRTAAIRFVCSDMWHPT